MVFTRGLLALSIGLMSLDAIHSWSPPTEHTITVASIEASRRDVMQRAAVAILGGGAALIVGPAPSFAAQTVPKPTDLVRLQKGHARVTYLLENWESITSVCGKGIMSDTERKQVVRTDGGGGGVCELTPLKVQDYLGYKSTEDPLFKADKLMVRAAPLVDPDQFEEYLDVVEKYREKADQGSMMAYTSSWGEANPNGGKDMMEEYLASTKADVQTEEKLLRKVLGYLDLKVLPSQK